MDFRQSSSSAHQVLFGRSRILNARDTYRRIDVDYDRGDPREGVDEATTTDAAGCRSPSNRPAPGSLADFFFGFMYEEDLGTEDDELYTRSTIDASTPLWRNSLHMALSMNLTLLAASTATAVTLVAAIGNDGSMAIKLQNDVEDPTNSNDANAFAARATSAAVLGTALGKLTMGPVPDVLGARRTSLGYSLALSIALILLALAPSQSVAIYCQFGVEFLYAIQWPCTIVVLATHYRGNQTGGYEGGIFVTSLASRLGSLMGIPVSSWLLRRGVHWRILACSAAWLAAVASSVTFFFVTDSIEAQDDPQNPVDPNILSTWFPDQYRRRKRWTISKALRLALFIFSTNVLPSVQHILGSGTFWIVAMAHTGSSMVRTSERVLGTYFSVTSDGALTSDRAASLAVWHSVGTVAGLLIAGQAFAGKQERTRKWMVSRLYLLAIAACYVLALTAIPAIHHEAPEFFTLIQVMAVAACGFGIAVQFYHIPSLVGATFGCDKGLFSAYTDGVAYGLASFVWKFVGNAVGSSGWAYGWAAVALLLILSAILMVEFMEHYFRARHGGTYETIILA